jgi:spermidine synthase/S-adenosylmethionine/arginine decarboxylase-like enzyme
VHPLSFTHHQYRPHYHEIVTHLTARFLDRIKRVVFVGGGDSMLLHEILKYPAIELVVGLEIDQAVTRSSFKHFGTQPHWDNEKVQWWYGDASKSLLMLPVDYFGTIDMVLVDLSETVTSALVTEGLDIMAALGLLLQSQGILVKNELYFKQMSSIFDYTIQVNVPDVPVVCAQTVSMGSPGLDFLYHIPKDHEVNGLFIRPQWFKEAPSPFWRDYRHNITSSFQQHCKSPDEPEQESETQTSSPGILMIVEAESLSMPLQSSQEVSTAIVKALKKEGLSIVSSSQRSTKNGENAVIVVILREGYVIVRTWPSQGYCALDILLWGSFEKHESIKKALLASVGGSIKSSSSYRIVTGGMFGVGTWKEDEKRRGPSLRLCKDTESPPRNTSPDLNNFAEPVLSEVLSLVQNGGSMPVVVICGHESQPCASLEAMRKNTNALDVIAIRTCPGISTGSENGQRFACETDVWKNLAEFVISENKVRAIVLDKSAPFAMAQIAIKIFGSRAKKSRILAKDILVIAPMFDPSEAWRWQLLDRFRTDIVIYEPVFSAEVLFNNTDSSVAMGVVSSGDRQFVQHLLDVVASIEKKTGLVSDIRNIENGLWPYFADFKPSLFALPGHYDHSSALEQWKSQKPVGFQTVFQFEMQKISKGDSVLGNFKGAGKWFPGVVTSIDYSDGTASIRYEDGDFEKDVELGRIRGSTKQGVKVPPLSAAQVKSALEGTRTMAAMDSFDSVNVADIQEFVELGDGSLHVAMWSEGIAMLLWDGKTHVDLNLFTYVESAKLANTFSDLLVQQIPYLQVVLRDEQPRGFGRVVNFRGEIREGVHPHWA